MLKRFAVLSALLLNTSIYATEPLKSYLIAPQCLIKAVKGEYNILGSYKNLKLVEVTAAGLDSFIGAKHSAEGCGAFYNVSSEWRTYQQQSNALHPEIFIKDYDIATHEYHDDNRYTISHEKEVNQALGGLNPQNMWTDLTHLTDYTDRYANSRTGVETANWLKQQVEAMAKQYERQDVTAYLVATCDLAANSNCDKRPEYKQPSVVVKFGNSDLPGVVIGGHMDTLASGWSKKPGADDDGSGTVTVLETARTLLASGLTFKRPIYFIWYSAEEEGLVGSKYVVKYFKYKNTPVHAVLHLDMTGYPAKSNPEAMWLVTDNVSDKLTAFLRALITTYVKKPVQETRCGYACSDHATWTRAGLPAAIAFEASLREMSPYIHSSNDTMSTLSLKHMTDYAKLAVAFGVELAEPHLQ